MAIAITFLAILILYLIIVIAKWGFRRSRNQLLLKKYGIPGPEPELFLGNFKELFKNLKPNEVITDWLQKYGNVFGYYVGGVPYIVVNDLEMLKQIMIKDFHIFENRPDMVVCLKPIDSSLIVQKGKRWKEVRSHLTPTFSSGKIKLMSTLVSKKVDITVAEVGKKVNKNELFDIYEFFQGLTLDVIADCAFAMKTHCQENSKDQFLTAVRQFFRYSNNKAIEYAIMFPFLANLMTFVNNNLTAGKMATLIVNNVTNVMKIRQENPEMRSMDLLQLMLDHRKKENMEGMTEEEIIANAYIFLLAGYETTATALAYTFYLLITHPEVQERLYQEINGAEDCSYNTITSLQYLDQVFNESLRLYPPLTGFITRDCIQDHKIGKYTIPKGAQIVAPVWDIHHNPEFWPDPWKFNPDRFSPENKGSLTSAAFFPFGIGPRNCVGARFALLEAKLAIFKLLKAFKFEMCEKTDHPIQLICSTVFINPANGVWLKAKPRNSSLS